MLERTSKKEIEECDDGMRLSLPPATNKGIKTKFSRFFEAYILASAHVHGLSSSHSQSSLSISNCLSGNHTLYTRSIMQFLSTIAALVACASAYTVLTPSVNSTIAKGSAIDVKWSSVDTDASTFSIYLVNFQTAHWPPTVLSLAQNVNRDDGVASVRIPCSVSSDYGWQLNFVSRPPSRTRSSPY